MRPCRFPSCPCLSEEHTRRHTLISSNHSLCVSSSLPPHFLSFPNRPLLEKLNSRFWWNKCLPLFFLSLPHWFLKPSLSPASLGKSCCLGTTSPTPSSLCLPFLLSYENVERADCSQSVHISGFLRWRVLIHHCPGVAHCHRAAPRWALSFLLLCGLQ